MTTEIAEQTVQPTDDTNEPKVKTWESAIVRITAH